MELAVVLLYYKDPLGRGIERGGLKGSHHQHFNAKQTVEGER